MLRIEMTAQVLSVDPPLCTRNEITTHEDGTWLLRISLMPDPRPIIELAGQATTPVGVVSAAITAAIQAAVPPQPLPLAPRPTAP